MKIKHLSKIKFGKLKPGECFICDLASSIPNQARIKGTFIKIVEVPAYCIPEPTNAVRLSDGHQVIMDDKDIVEPVKRVELTR